MNTNNFNILGFDTELTVVIDRDAKEFLPVIIKSGNLYDPQNSFKPINPKPKQKSLTDDQRNRAQQIMDEAQKTWKPAQTEKPAAPKAEKPAIVPATAPTTPQTTLDTLIAEAVAKLSVNSVLGNAIPALDEFISKKYGILPKVIEVKTEKEAKPVVGMTHEKFEMVLKLVAADIPVFLTGPAGCGKNVLCKQIAEALGKEFYFSNAVTQEYKITGFIDANGTYQETQFYKAFTQGGVFMLDEMDASTPEVLVILNAAIANRYFDFPVGRMDAHPDFRIVCLLYTSPSPRD